MQIKYLFVFLTIALLAACGRKSPDVRPYQVHQTADSLYREACGILERTTDVDSAGVALTLMDRAIAADTLCPIYYRAKAKLLAEMGQLQKALHTQYAASLKGAMDAESYLQLGLFQDALDIKDSARINYKESKRYLDEILRQHPDSLGAFIFEQLANSLIERDDSLFFKDLDGIRKRFHKRLWEVEMVKKTKPSKLVESLRQINAESIIYEMGEKKDSVG